MAKQRADQPALFVVPEKHSEIAAEVEHRLETPCVKGGVPTQPELDRDRFEREIWYELAQREHTLEQLNRVRYQAHALLDYLELYVPAGTVPHKEKYIRLIRALHESLRGRP